MAEVDQSLRRLLGTVDIVRDDGGEMAAILGVPVDQHDRSLPEHPRRLGRQVGAEYEHAVDARRV